MSAETAGALAASGFLPHALSALASEAAESPISPAAISSDARGLALLAVTVASVVAASARVSPAILDIMAACNGYAVLGDAVLRAQGSVF